VPSKLTDMLNKLGTSLLYTAQSSSEPASATSQVARDVTAKKNGELN
jgi:hypothetical protein